MATAKLETAAEKYRRLKQAKEILHDVECTCGMTWKCRRADKDFWVTSGILPTSMIEVMARVAKRGQDIDEAELIKSMATDEIVNSIVFSNKVVLFTAVEPKIVEKATEPNELSQDEVMRCCYDRLRDWQLKGGDEAARLETFPKE